MSKENKHPNIKDIGVSIIIHVCYLLVMPLFTHISLDIAHLYKIPFLKELTPIQIVGAMIILWMLRFPYENSGDESISNLKKEATIKLLAIAIVYLYMWGLAYLVHWILVVL